VIALLFELRLALRALRRDRAFTLSAVTTLALGIALNTTVSHRDGRGIRGLARAGPDLPRDGVHRVEPLVTFRDGDGRAADLVTFRVSRSRCDASA
jgi:hypothetical protein